jgi:hypothetical protein
VPECVVDATTDYVDCVVAGQAEQQPVEAVLHLWPQICHKINYNHAQKLVKNVVLSNEKKTGSCTACVSLKGTQA